MSTKRAVFIGSLNGSRDDQYDSINLNKFGTTKVLQSESIISSKNNENTNALQVLTCFVKDTNFETTKSSVSTLWQKDNLLKTNSYSQNFHHHQKDNKGHNKNVDKNSNKSTLSLHIEAYENANKTQNNDGAKAVIKMNKEEIKKWKNTTNCFSDSTVKTLFEFPRQQEGGDKMDNPEIMKFKASQKLFNPNQAQSNGGGGETGGGENQNGSDLSPAAIGIGGAVDGGMLKGNSDNAIERDERRKTSPQNDNNAINKESSGKNSNNLPNGNNNEEQGNSDGGENNEEGSDSESSDGFLKGLQSDDSFHGMLPDEDINKLLQYHADYILHTVEKDEGKGRVIGMSILWNKEKIFVQVRAGECGVTFDMKTYMPTILELTKYHLAESIPVTTTKSGQPVIPRRPVLREDWELRHDDVELLEKLGEGAFGEVRLGKLKQKNKGTINVAVKVIKGTVTKKAVEEAMKEARIMRKYNHPNVVRFYGVQAEVEPLMLLMEFVKGGSLDSYLKKNRESITVSNRASMCYDAACGLEYLHLQDCIHRDIAARNCLMDVSSRRLKISDFGLSSIGAVQVLDPSKPAPIRWLSPEVIRTGCFAKPADVWSFGILCWEIYMDAEVPYKEYTMGEVQKRIMDEGFRLRLPLTCQTELRKLIALCWIGDPNKRPTMSDCVRALKPFFDEKKKYITDDAVKMVARHKKHKKKKNSRPKKPEKESGDSKKSLIKSKGLSRASHLSSPNGRKGNRKRTTKPKENEKNRKQQGAGKKGSGGRGRTGRKADSPKSDASDTDKAGNSNKSSSQLKEHRKHRSNPRSSSPPTTNSKASLKKSPKKSGGKDRKKITRQSGSDEDRKNRKGSDEDRKSKDSTQKKKNKNRRK